MITSLKGRPGFRIVNEKNILQSMNDKFNLIYV